MGGPHSARLPELRHRDGLIGVGQHVLDLVAWRGRRRVADGRGNRRSPRRARRCHRPTQGTARSATARPDARCWGAGALLSLSLFKTGTWDASRCGRERLSAPGGVPRGAGKRPSCSASSHAPNRIGAATWR